MATGTNVYCALCDKAYNTINGRYCPTLKRIVEYDKQPQCSRIKTTTKKQPS